jgi:hypothetical protein
MDGKQSAYQAASIMMDQMNAEEQEKVEMEQFEEKMRQREITEKQRAEELTALHKQVADFQEVLDALDQEIQFVLELNRDPNIAAEDKEANIAAISTMRENYF